MNQQLQFQLNEFSHGVRQGEISSDSGLNAEKTELYHSLVLGNLQEVVEPCFPILRSIVCQNVWHELLFDFFQTTKLETPIFHQLPYEFVKYLQNINSETYPFMAELAHYEWVELELELAESVQSACNINEKEVLNTPWQLASCARLLAYDYNVHDIGEHYQPVEKVPTYLAVYQHSGKVNFMILNQPCFQLLECILEEAQPPIAVIEEVCELYPNLVPEQLSSQIHNLIYELYKDGVLLPQP